MSNAELEVIAAVCENKDIAALMQGSNVDDMFTAYKDVWLFVKDHHNRYRAVPSMDVIKKNFDEIDDVTVSSPTNYYVAQLREQYVAGEMRKMLLQASKALDEKGAQFTYEKMFTKLSQLGKFATNVKDVDLTDFDAAEQAFNLARERTQQMGGTPGIPSGFVGMDSAYKTGAAPGHLIVLLGYTGRAKSFFSNLWAVNAWKLGYKPMVLSLEMTPDEYRNRTYAMMNPGRFSINEMVTGDVNIDDMREWAGKAFDDKNGFIVPSMSGVLDLTPNVIQAKIDTHKPDFVVVDYLQLMQDNARSENMVQRMLNLTNELKSLAQANEIPIVAISAVKDESGDKRDSPPELNQVSWSRAIEYNANMAAAIHLDPETGLIEVAGRKNRGGPLFDFYIRADIDKGLFVEEYE